MGLLDRLDDKVIGPKGKPPPAKQRRQGAAGLAVLVVVLLVAALAAPGHSAYRVWQFLVWVGAIIVFGGGSRYFKRERYRDDAPPPTPTVDHNTSTTDSDMTGFAAAILDAEPSSDRDAEPRGDRR